MKQQILDRHITTTTEPYSPWEKYNNTATKPPAPKKERKEPDSGTENVKQCTNTSRHLLKIFLTHMVLASIIVTFLIVSPLINTFAASLFMLLTYVGGYRMGRNTCTEHKK